MANKLSDMQRRQGAERRVNASPRLSKHSGIIFDDSWADDTDHLNWVRTAPVGEIEGWAEVVEDGVAEMESA